jgi:hypothetical protein
MSQSYLWCSFNLCFSLRYLVAHENSVLVALCKSLGEVNVLIILMLACIRVLIVSFAEYSDRNIHNSIREWRDTSYQGR